MKIITNRLKLEQVSLNDLPNIHDLHSDPEVDKYNTLGIPANIEDTEQVLRRWLKHHERLERKSYTYAIRLLDSGQFAGLIALNTGKPDYRNAEVWYKLNPRYWNKGYVSEALTALLGFGFTSLNLHRIEAGVAVENLASIRVLEKAGFLREGRKRKLLPIRGEWSDNYFYAILDTDWQS